MSPPAARNSPDAHHPAGLLLSSPEATQKLGARIAPCLKAGDIIGLEGPLGAGKSLLARSILQARMALAGVPVEDVPSPTFTLVQTYEFPALEIWHADLYRLSEPDEVLELGLTDAFQSAACLIEWPDRLGPFWPAGGIVLTLKPAGDTARLLNVTGAADHPMANLISGHDD